MKLLNFIPKKFNKHTYNSPEDSPFGGIGVLLS